MRSLGVNGLWMSMVSEDWSVPVWPGGWADMMELMGDWDWNNFGRDEDEVN